MSECMPQELRKACCVCGTARYTRVLEGFSPWPVLGCSRCGMVYLDGQADQNLFVEDAANQIDAVDGAKQVEYWSFPRMYETRREVFEGYFAERLSRLRESCEGLESVLDVGCGFGFFMRYLAEQGVGCWGLDIERESVSYAREQLGLDVALLDFADYESDDRFDAIVACDVLEHVAEPEAFLTKCRDMLSDDGVVYLQVPNVLGDVLPAGGSYNWPYHLWQFSPYTLEALLNKSGYDVCRWWTGVMGVIGVYEAGGPDEETEAMWARAAAERRGNRLQVLARPI